jgi:hypothetical protein
MTAAQNGDSPMDINLTSPAISDKHLNIGCLIF